MCLLASLYVRACVCVCACVGISVCSAAGWYQMWNLSRDHFRAPQSAASFWILLRFYLTDRRRDLELSYPGQYQSVAGRLVRMAPGYWSGYHLVVAKGKSYHISTDFICTRSSLPGLCPSDLVQLIIIWSRSFSSVLYIFGLMQDFLFYLESVTSFAWVSIRKYLTPSSYLDDELGCCWPASEGRFDLWPGCITSADRY